MKKLTFILATALVLTGCDKLESLIAGDAPPKTLVYEINLTSPDNALKSWWRFLDARSDSSYAYCMYHSKRTQGQVDFSALATGETAAYLINRDGNCTRSVMNRVILEIKQETDTRAVALAKIKNATPSTIVPTSAQEKRREEGEQFKYLIEKDDAGWKVSQVYRYNSVNVQLGRGDPWEKQYDSMLEFYPAYVTSYQ